MDNVQHILPVGADVEVVLIEKSGAGNLWDLSPLSAAGITVLSRAAVANDADPDAVGGHMRRSLIVRAEAPVTVEVVHRRPWLKETDENAVCGRATFTFA